MDLVFTAIIFFVLGAGAAASYFILKPDKADKLNAEVKEKL